MFTLNMPFITIKKLRCLFLKPIVKMPKEKMICCVISRKWMKALFIMHFIKFYEHSIL